MQNDTPKKSIDFHPLQGYEKAFSLTMNDSTFGKTTIVFCGENALYNAWVMASEFMMGTANIDVKKHSDGAVTVSL